MIHDPTPWRRLGVLLLGILLLAACSGGGERGRADETAVSDAKPESAAVPVEITAVARATLDVVVTAPGVTRSLRQDRVRAPFAARLLTLDVADGDRVAADQVVAEVVAKDSEAALQGARSMLAAARTPQDTLDARRALALAERDRVQRVLRAPASGIVLSHGAQAGDYVDEGEVLMTITEAGAVDFEAQVAQSDLALIHGGEPATVDLPALAAPVPMVVHGVLPNAVAENLSAPVRLDFASPPSGVTVGLFGTARIVVGRRQDVTVVPASAVLRDDVSGESRIAVVNGGHAHWIVVRTGVTDAGRVEILDPPLAEATQVITAGQVGLPEGAPVRAVVSTAPLGRTP